MVVKKSKKCSVFLLLLLLLFNYLLFPFKDIAFKQ